MKKDWAKIFGPGKWKTINRRAVYVRDKGPSYTLRDALKEAVYKPEHKIVNGINVSDVTSEYEATAKPGQGRIYVQSGTSKYEIENGRPNKKKIRDETVQAQWIIDTFGGDVTLVRPNASHKPFYEYPKGSVAPDLIWKRERLEYWELKEPGNPHQGDKLYQHGIHQISINKGMAAGNAGGIIVKIHDKNVPESVVINRITDRFRQEGLEKADVIIKYSDEKYTVWRLHK